MAYQGLREGDSYESFTRRLVIAKSNGVEVGDINHSRAFISRFRDCCRTVVMERIATFFETEDPATGRLPIVAVIADKVTENRRTGQLVGVIVMVEGRLVAIFIDDLVVRTHTALGLAENIVAALGKVRLTKEKLKKQMAGGAFDGQYIVLGADRKLCELVDIDRSFVCLRWDNAHRLELSLGDARKRVAWYAELSTVVGGMVETMSTGRGYEVLMQAAEELMLRLYAPKLYCDSRFAQSERAVYKNFLLNLASFHRALANDVGASRWSKNDVAKLKHERMMSLCTCALVVGRVAGVFAVLKEVEQLSLLSQKVNTLPWELAEAVDGFLSTMGSLAMLRTFGEFRATLSALKEMGELEGFPYTFGTLELNRKEPPSSEAPEAEVLERRRAAAARRAADMAARAAADLAERAQPPPTPPILPADESALPAMLDMRALTRWTSATRVPFQTTFLPCTLRGAKVKVYWPLMKKCFEGGVRLHFYLTEDDAAAEQAKVAQGQTVSEELLAAGHKIFVHYDDGDRRYHDLDVDGENIWIKSLPERSAAEAMVASLHARAVDAGAAPGVRPEPTEAAATASGGDSAGGGATVGMPVSGEGEDVSMDADADADGASSSSAPQGNCDLSLEEEVVAVAFEYLQTPNAELRASLRARLAHAAVALGASPDATQLERVDSYVLLTMTECFESVLVDTRFRPSLSQSSATRRTGYATVDEAAALLKSGLGCIEPPASVTVEASVQRRAALTRAAKRVSSVTHWYTSVQSAAAVSVTRWRTHGVPTSTGKAGGARIDASGVEVLSQLGADFAALLEHLSPACSGRFGEDDSTALIRQCRDVFDLRAMVRSVASTPEDIFLTGASRTIHLRMPVVYPLDQIDCVMVEDSDLDCLEPGQFLNDTVIDYRIRRAMYDSGEDKKHNIYSFNSFFFTKLNREGVMDPKEKHAGVRRWTSGVDIFAYSFLSIPIAHAQHWFEAIVCLPSQAGEEAKADGQAPERLRSCILLLDSMRDVSGSREWVGNAICEYLQCEWDLRKRGKGSPKPAELAAPATGGSGEPDAAAAGGGSGGGGNTAGPAAPSKEPTAGDVAAADVDSGEGALGAVPEGTADAGGGGAERSEIVAAAAAEPEATFGPKIFDKRTMPLVLPHVPQQNNYHDCGLFVCEFACSFIREVAKHGVEKVCTSVSKLRKHRVPSCMREDWFDGAKVQGSRTQFMEELKALDVEQNDAGVEEGDDAKESERVRTSMVAVHGWLKLGVNDLPPVATLLAQRETLREALAADWRERPDLRRAWVGTAKKAAGGEDCIVGTDVVLKTAESMVEWVFTQARYYDGCRDFLYAFQLVAAKTSNEAVVEGMGAVLDIHADPKRHLTHDHMVAETLIHYNGPVPWESDSVVKAALSLLFGGQDEVRFFTKDRRAHSRQALGNVGVAIDSLKRTKTSKLTFMR